MTLDALPYATVTHVELRVHQKGKRHLEDVVDFVRIGSQFEAARDDAEHGGDAKACRGEVIRQPTNRFHEVTVEPDLLLGFAQRRHLRRDVTRIDRTAWEGNLAG